MKLTKKIVIITLLDIITAVITSYLFSFFAYNNQNDLSLILLLVFGGFINIYLLLSNIIKLNILNFRFYIFGIELIIGWFLFKFSKEYTFACLLLLINSILLELFTKQKKSTL